MIKLTKINYLEWVTLRRRMDLIQRLDRYYIFDANNFLKITELTKHTANLIKIIVKIYVIK